MKLFELATTFNVQAQVSERWVIFGPEATAFKAKLPLTTVKEEHSIYNLYMTVAEFDGLLLAGALSVEISPLYWLKQLVASIKEGTTLVTIDWQADGPLNYGPDLKHRFKRGKLCRFLREAGFGLIETLDNHPYYYVIRAIKGSPPALPHATKFIEVAKLKELPKNMMKKVEISGQTIIIANTGKEIVAFAQTCPHAGALLDKGRLRGRNVICPLHAYIWNVCTGEPVEPADEDTLPLYAVKIDREHECISVALTTPPVSSQ